MYVSLAVDQRSDFVTGLNNHVPTASNDLKSFMISPPIIRPDLMKVSLTEVDGYPNYFSKGVMDTVQSLIKINRIRFKMRHNLGLKVVSPNINCIQTLEKIFNKPNIRF